MSATTTDDFGDLVDLASERYGGAALVANDDFFAEKENLLKPAPAIWREGVYTDKGKWMDGWETRRRRDLGPEAHDWCVIRLGLPGRVRTLVVDTAFFRGNFPAECALDATDEDPLAATSPSDVTWTRLLPRTALLGDHKNRFVIDDAVTSGGGRRFTHVRLVIYPDGGVARLRVLGEVAPDWRALTRFGGMVNLAALENGAVALACSDMFFGERRNLIQPGHPINMSDGWETRRRRGPGHDWSLVRLGAPGVARRVEIDTSWFKGNAPGRCTLEGCHAPGATTAQLTAADATEIAWRPLLGDTRLFPHRRHFFDELRAVGPITHVRLAIFPEGGVARLRVHGEPALGDPAQSEVDRLNALSPVEAEPVLRSCCGSPRWAERMVAARPFEDLPAMVRAGERIWWSLAEVNHLQAFAAHPRIGDKKEAASATAASATWSSAEQSQIAAADLATLDELARLNRAYEERFGFIYIVCATGKSPDQLLAILRGRAAPAPGDARATELRTAAEEQCQITTLRLRKLCQGS